MSVIDLDVIEYAIDLALVNARDQMHDHLVDLYTETEDGNILKEYVENIDEEHLCEEDQNDELVVLIRQLLTAKRELNS